MTPTVTIVVPIYNVERYLKRCIHSIQTQTLRNIEIILVDDESPDRCPEICDAYAKEDDRIKVIHKKNGGLGYARNAGIEIALGSFIAFIDSDDYIEPDMFQVLYEKAVTMGADTVISGGFIVEYANGNKRVSQDVKELAIFEGNTEDIPLKMMGAKSDFLRDYEYEMSACKGIYCLKLLKEHNIRFHSERELISEDLKFHFDYFQKSDKAVLIPDIFYHYCENEISLTKLYDKKRFYKNVDFYNYMIKDMKDLGYSCTSKEYADRMLLARARVAIGQIEKHYKRYYCATRNEIHAICCNETLKKILESYPIGKLPIKQRLFVYCLKYKSIVFLYLLVKINNRKF